MRYVEFSDAIRDELRRSPAGLTWAQLRQRLDLPYTRPCPTWIERMQREIGLTRTKGTGRALVWKLGPRKTRRKPERKVLPRSIGG